MLDKKYYEGYEGEGRVKIWREENGKEIGFVIWAGFFNAILEGCFKPDFQRNGIIECYYNQDGFYDEKWEMSHSDNVLEELKAFDENLLNTKSKEMIKIAKEIIERLISFINTAAFKEEKVYVEYE